mmetsp:Transcript_13315/g.28779  ORF Transcript_13315/g.28779 Transcript_13315/m.28779 type:complete len:209 (+) Transcript_13315:1877-2503(+)
MYLRRRTSFPTFTFALPYSVTMLLSMYKICSLSPPSSTIRSRVFAPRKMRENDRFSSRNGIPLFRFRVDMDCLLSRCRAFSNSSVFWPLWMRSMEPMSTTSWGLDENPASAPSNEFPPTLLLPTLPMLAPLLRTLLRMLGRFRPLPPLLAVRSSLSVRGSTEIMNLSEDIVSVAGSSFPLDVTLNALMPRRKASVTDMCSRADLKLLR